jgi:hypothetical protein
VRRDDDPVCGERALDGLKPVERAAYETARAKVARGESVPPDIAETLLAAIDWLEHDCAHAHYGALRCDREAGR